MRFLRRRCAFCGMRLPKEGFIERGGRRFCSEEHAREYQEEMSAMPKKGGCC